MPNVKTYYKSKSGNVNLSKNFKVKEFACKDGTDKLLVDLEMIYILQKIRDLANSSVIINSGYRTKSWNQKVCGASNSYHLYGRAFDISCNIGVENMCRIANSLGVKGILKYANFVHIDSRENQYFYDYANNKPLAVGKYLIPYKGTLLKVGSRGEEVGIIQFKLNSLGYICGTADGIFGNKTLTAVKQFQKDHALVGDGIVGILTWNKLFN
jgi:hypothetical protein